MVAVLEISLAKFVTSIVTVSALIVALLLKLFPAVTLNYSHVRSASLRKSPAVIMPKLLKLVKSVKEVLLWKKSSVSIKFKLSDETVALIEVISSAIEKIICHFNCQVFCIDCCPIRN